MTHTESRALELLGSGNISSAQVAAALGVSESYISQLLSREDFAAQVAERRFNALQKHNTRDSLIDTLEDEVLAKLQETLPLVMRPMELTRIFQTINAAKRRGSSAPESTLQHSKIVNITIPVLVANKFSVTPENQALVAGTQELLTMQSGTLLNLHKNLQAQKEIQSVDESPGRSVALSGS